MNPKLSLVPVLWLLIFHLCVCRLVPEHQPTTSVSPDLWWICSKPHSVHLKLHIYIYILEPYLSSSPGIHGDWFQDPCWYASPLYKMEWYLHILMQSSCVLWIISRLLLMPNKIQVLCNTVFFTDQLSGVLFLIHNLLNPWMQNPQIWRVDYILCFFPKHTYIFT